MSNYSKADFVDADQGLDYVFVMLGGIYGQAFNRNWEGMDLEVVRQIWKDQIGRFLTYKPSLDYAFTRLNGDFPPSAIKFREFCNAGPAIPRDELQITHNPTPVDPAVVADAKRKLKELRGRK
ncbi:hypothetical protein UFOVP259_7 [uncultured Caudovirales phage]|uniref:Uncharacterized protein n=1 Tax=uncultured Caudovirales phage TaxID=2100421 RepID=A0A6J5LG76_9CAUD|nr:hypothetical protein UFOVP259_7 [uncultured Caudovirales phage]